ncbi:MAG: aminopeptidase [DPANN group archaeon]|nr:aminopeptidase [DPANN group archaeon]
MDNDADNNIINLPELEIPDLDKILKNGWDIKKGDTAIIITDKGHNENTLAPLLAKKEKEALEKIGCNCKIYIQNIKSGLDMLDTDILEKIKTLEPNSIVIVSVSETEGTLPKHYNTNFKSFVLQQNLKLIFTRDLSKTKKADWNIFTYALSFNSSKDTKKLLKLKKQLDNGKQIRITTKKGTDLILDITDRHAYLACGNYNWGGTNLPFGEIYIAPVENKSNGTVIIDGTQKNLFGTELVTNDFILKFKDGHIIQNTSKKLSSTIAQIETENMINSKNINTLCELGIGLNPNAKLIGLMVVDEKTLGTAHIAIGSNTSFSGKNECNYHFDQVFTNPNIWVDGKKLKI